jgi:hypothetical protein
MKTPWKRYLSLQLPCAALVWALTVQGLASSLSDIPLLRDRPDELALAVLKDPTNYRILLFGDSITRFSTVRFSMGTPGEVGNLSTHGDVGLIGSMFLLERYLSTHASPEHVVVSMAPSIYHRGNSMRIARHNFWSTFNRQDERDFLRTYIPGIDGRDLLPAVLNVQERIVEPFSSYFVYRRRAPRIEAGSLSANSEAPVELALRAATEEEEAFGDKRDLTLSAINAGALGRICSLGNNYGFRTEIVWPPIPAQLENMLISSGALTELETKIRSIMVGSCDFGGFTDFNKIRTYPNLAFRNDLAHLLGDGWEQRYTADMIKYLNGLYHQTPAVPANAVGSSGIGRSVPDRIEARTDAPAR